jgi:hypothetical protein
MTDNNDHSGKQLYRYEDILRAIGRYIDEEGMQDIVVLQADDQMKAHGYRNISVAGGNNPRLVEHTFTAEELKEIDDEARKRRGRGSRLFG